jgi:hypothetical protein
VLTVHELDPADAAELFPDGLAEAGIDPSRWEAGCAAGEFVVFVAERDEDAVGFAVVSSNPRRLRLAALGGDGAAAGALLDRVVPAAGERDVSAWCPADRPRLGDLLRRRGFARVGQSDRGGPPLYLYKLSRNDGA